MGCTSGGVRVSGEGFGDGQSKMVHFRTLDWGMDLLRHVVVQLDFLDREGGDVIARSVTYVGFVGVLTGVRPGFSVSLNFRNKHHSGSWMDTVKYRFHQGCVLFGLKPSISSILRHSILPPRKKSKEWWSWIWQEEPSEPDMFSLWMKTIPKIPSTCCYLIFCNGQDTYVIEKDRKGGKTLDACNLIAATNHDYDDEGLDANKDQSSDMEVEIGGQSDHEDDEAPIALRHGVEDELEDSINGRRDQAGQVEPEDPSSVLSSGDGETTFLIDTIEESMERKYELYKLYNHQIDSAKAKLSKTQTNKTTKSLNNTSQTNVEAVEEPHLSQSQIQRILTTYPITNECTHFALLMDPLANDIIWARRWLEPADVEKLEKRESLDVNPRVHLFSEEYQRLKDE